MMFLENAQNIKSTDKIFLLTINYKKCFYTLEIYSKFRFNKETDKCIRRHNYKMNINKIYQLLMKIIIKMQ